MPTLRATDRPTALRLEAGDALYVTAPTGSSVYVVEPVDLSPAQTVTGTSVQFGPYTVAQNLVLTCTAGAVSFDVRSPALSAAQAAEVRALVSGDGNPGMGSWLYAANSAMANSDNSAAATALCQLIFVPVKYSSVRIGWMHLGGNGALSGLRMIAAATEDYGDLSNTNTTAGKTWVTPRRGGTEYNAIQWEGWRAVTWGGAATGSAVDAGAENISVAWSDVVSLDAIPVASDPSGRFNGWYPLLIRAYPGAGYYSRLTYIGFSDTAKFLAECGPQAVLGFNRGGAGDASITSPSGWSASATVSASDANMLPLIVEAWGPGQPASIMLTGDSRFGAPPASESGTWAYRNLGFRIEAAARAAGVPAGVLRCAHAGKTTTIYSGRSLAVLAGSPRPRVSVYLAYSINDGVPTAQVCAEAKSRVLAHIARCRDLGIVPVLVSIFPSTSGYFRNNTRAQEFDSWCASLGVVCISPMARYGVPSTGDWQPGWAEDTNHMTPAGYNDLAAHVFDTVRAYL